MCVGYVWCGLVTMNVVFCMSFMYGVGDRCCIVLRVCLFLYFRRSCSYFCDDECCFCCLFLNIFLKVVMTVKMWRYCVDYVM